MTCTSTEDRTWVRGSVEYLKYLVTADVELDQAVFISLDRTTWLTGEWVGVDEVVAGKHQRTVRVLISDAALPEEPETTAEVFIRITDNPEAPVIAAGFLTFV